MTFRQLRLSFLFLALGALSPALPAAADPVEVQARVIGNFRPGSGETRFGKLEFVGGLELTSDEPLFGAWSSIRFLQDGRHFLGVLDTGHWLRGTIRRGDDGRLAGLDGVALSPMVDAAGRAQPGKYDMDAESLALRGDKALVGFEQKHRIDVYPGPDSEKLGPEGSLPLPFPVRELRNNGGLETIAVAPAGSPLDGAVVTVAERSVDEDGNLFAGIVDRAMKGAFRVVRRDGYDITDGAFLPDGDLLLLERRFSLATGIGMRIRRIAGSEIRPGAVVDGEALIDAGYGHQIDNMEGLDVILAEDGSVRIVVVSDDNHSILQRNLMLEFRLAE